MKRYLIFKDKYVELYNCDCKLALSENLKVNLVFADPEFGIDLTDFYGLLYDFDNMIDGHTFIMSNERHLAKEIVLHDEYFRRMFAVNTVVPNMINSKVPMTQVDYIAEFRKLGADNNKFINLKDGFTTLITSPKYRNRKNYSQNFDKGLKLYYEIFGHYTKIGDIILDPFCGSGNSLIAARRMKRKILGFEINTKSANHAKAMLQQYELY